MKLLQDLSNEIESFTNEFIAELQTIDTNIITTK